MRIHVLIAGKLKLTPEWVTLSFSTRIAASSPINQGPLPLLFSLDIQVRLETGLHYRL